MQVLYDDDKLTILFPAVSICQVTGKVRFSSSPICIQCSSIVHDVCHPFCRYEWDCSAV